MLDIPPEYIVRNTLAVGAIYKMTAPEMINTDIAHYFIVIAINEDEIPLLLSTTKRNRKINRFEIKGYSFTSLVYIEPTKRNGLTKDSYIDCNEYYPYTVSELVMKVAKKEADYVGILNYDDYNHLREGVLESDVNDLPADILVHPED